MDDIIYRRDALSELRDWRDACVESGHRESASDLKDVIRAFEHLPSAQREPISEAYAKAVRNWLVGYQLKCVELKGRYTPYEVLGWVVNDWGKKFGE